MAKPLSWTAERRLPTSSPHCFGHNENCCDIRDYVKVRKISGGTRSDRGRQCRDTFSSLKKICRKLGVSFWAYLTDRLTAAGNVPPLADLMCQRAA